MELIERYLAAIARDLPAKQRDDVVAELRDELLSKKEEREEILGRPMTEAEVEALLKDFGPPLVVASRYWPVQHLIGPETFPYYLSVLKVAALIVLGVQVVLAVIHMATTANVPQALAQLPGGIWTSLLTAFAWVTVAFVAVELLGLQKKLARNWKAAELPPLNVKLRKSRFDLVFEAAAGVIFVLWWTEVIHFQNFVGNPHNPDLKIEMTAAWAPFWWPILLYSLARIVANLSDLLRPGWVKFNAALNAATCLAATAIAIALLRADGLIVTSGFGEAGSANVAEGIELGLNIAFIVIAVTSAFEMLGALRRLVRWPQPRGGALAI